MKYNLAVPAEAQEAFEYLTKLVGLESMAEVKKISPNRSLNQNAYLHLLIGVFGAHFGYTAEEAKYVYKEINKHIYLYEKKGRKFWRSSADLTKEEMARSIDLFMQKSAEHGCRLPQADETEWIKNLENQLEKQEYYLQRGNQHD